MWKQIFLLTGVALRNLWGWNQIKYGKDRKQKNRLLYLAAAYILLALVLAMYSAMLGFGCVMLGMGNVVPAYVLAIVSIVILFFTIFKAGSIIFDAKSYEMTAALPVHPAAIIMSRFLNLYVQNIGLGLIVMLPAAGVYAFSTRPGISFYVTMFIGALLMPFLPMTIATAVGALVTAVSARMKHKTLVSVVLTMVITIGIIVLSTAGSYMGATGEFVITEAGMQEFAGIVEQQIYGIYPPARFFSEGVVYGNGISFLIFALISILPLVLTVALVQWKFAEICTALNAGSTGGTYRIQELTQSSVRKALFRKEWKLYFSSSSYVMNTLIGYILMVLVGAGIAFAGMEKVDEIMGIPGLITKAVPLVLALMCSISPTTTSSVSMEGKQWWLTRSLPVTTAQILDGKILLNLALALPCYILTELLLLLSVKTTLLGYMWMLLVPLAYILFMSVLGITVNVKMPVFTWESDINVVKQSGAVFVMMIIGMVSTIVPMILIFIAPGILSDIVMGAVTVLVLTVTVILYEKNKKIDLKSVE